MKHGFHNDIWCTKPYPALDSSIPESAECHCWGQGCRHQKFPRNLSWVWLFSLPTSMTFLKTQFHKYTFSMMTLPFIWPLNLSNFIYWAYSHSVPLALTHINEKSKYRSHTYKTYIMHIYRMNSKIAKRMMYIHVVVMGIGWIFIIGHRFKVNEQLSIIIGCCY